jgi:hypothetical protein
VLLAVGVDLPVAERSVGILPSADRLEHTCQACEVVAVERRRDVEIPRLQRNAVQHGGRRPCHDIPHTLVVQELQ